ncbi:unnamed protein product [Vitrella brassicaformis CCMP3155]|uniref:TsaA-like domain-containing protein n=2 Tax=Vitrella brassicaformis TaxID=1169539 RepID=A0A0G4F040_VITBC|nr:unnamed protein product [Vitrella brassicaformis CCMP3155]|mmetsp:Transcript_23638/g.58447  ORF Transcript_23638/g.58447 Transcript_23638/m.58447 type:complete len:266 (+) Transcript_23638:57-854(+)|eukprot:CEM04951.1 unnamed protein product [Vitrella brassicaformis CCMP3155]
MLPVLPLVYTSFAWQICQLREQDLPTSASLSINFYHGRGRLRLTGRREVGMNGDGDADSESQPGVIRKGPLAPRRFYAEDADVPEAIEMHPIGVVRSPYKERFGTPRQPVVTEGTLGGVKQNATVQLLRGHGYEACLEDVEGFERVWLITYMHLNQGWRSKVRVYPRKLPRRLGLFATRAPHRPNQLALSAVEVVGVDVDAGQLHILGLDLLDGTPVLDIKPYVPYADAFPDSAAGWLDQYDREQQMGRDEFGHELPPWCAGDTG